ncbi:SPOR domain-containing protein [Shimia abyssi]|uniref:Sporulation related protein n=1 Tax=Shimia abyssi TaxID=1662395 RepID=A0A2P8FIT0_9RHOB|nr:SPOR domain-containing protein [Shimia abyssi]PSL21609.1 sporulation related protein [Shimia abyssi]
MADIPMGTRGVDPNEPRNAGKAMSWAGTFVSVVLVVGTCVWGYKLLVRDVSGVPVVRALEGPMREKPETPGGRPAENQGLAVNTVAADGTAGAPADRLVLAPAPISLNENDAAVLPTSTPAVEKETLETATAAPQEIVAPPPLQAGEALSVEELAARLAAGATPLANDPQIETPPVVTALSDVEEVVEPEPSRPVIQGGIKRSLRPVARPATLSATFEVASASPAIDAAPKVIEDPSEIPVGTRMVQLGAYATPEIAAVEWGKLSDRFSDYLGDKTRVIQKASSGGKVFYRLRAMGFADVSDARRLCSALKAENADCIPVTTR